MRITFIAQVIIQVLHQQNSKNSFHSATCVEISGCEYALAFHLLEREVAARCGCGMWNTQRISQLKTCARHHSLSSVPRALRYHLQIHTIVCLRHVFSATVMTVCASSAWRKGYFQLLCTSDELLHNKANSCYWATTNLGIFHDAPCISICASRSDV